jgi:hypothetical protein
MQPAGVTGNRGRDKMTVGELLGGGWNIITRRPKELIIWTVIQFIVGAALVAAIVPFVMSVTQAQQAALANGGAAAPNIPAGIGLFLLAYVLILVWLLMMFTAVVRATANEGGDRFAWLRFGGDELRLIGLGLLYIVATVVLWLLISIPVGIIIALAATGNATAGVIVGIVFGIICFCGAIWLSVRLSLVGAVFVLEKSFALRKGWQATKGHFWTLFLTYLVMAIVYIVFQVILAAIVNPGAFGAMFGGATDPQQAIERQQQMMATFMSPSIGLIIIWIVGTVIGTAAMVYYFGVIATAAIAGTGYSRQDLAELESHFE